MVMHSRRCSQNSKLYELNNQLFLLNRLQHRIPVRPGIPEMRHGIRPARGIIDRIVVFTRDSDLTYVWPSRSRLKIGSASARIGTKSSSRHKSP
jgi:hypothetical protein